jgi:NADPH:quinone reductase-like Zn-dependent oxidoreductase
MKIQVHTVFPFDEAKEVFRILEQGQPKGKIVLEIKS